MSKLVPSKYRDPHYSTRLYRAFYLYLEKYHDPRIFEEICADLGVPPEYLLEGDNWVSNEFVKDFNSKLKLVTGDPDIIEKCGRFGISPFAIGHVEYALNQAILFPAILYLTLPSQWRRYSRVYVPHVRWAGWGKFVIWTKPVDRIKPPIDVCRNTVGMLSGTENFFGLDWIHVKHSRCLHRGDDRCEYLIEYSAKGFWLRRLKSVAYFACFGVLGLVGSRWISKAPAEHFSNWISWLFLAPYILAGIAVFFMRKYLAINRYISDYNHESYLKAAELAENYRKLDRRYQESTLLRLLALKLNGVVDPRDVIKMTMDELSGRFGFSRALVMLRTGDGSRLCTEEVRGFEGVSSELYRLNIEYPAQKGDPQLFANVLSEGSTEAIFDIDSYRSVLKEQNRALVDRLGVTSLIIAPIQDAEEKYGLLIVGSVGEDRKLNSDDVHLIDNISSLLSVSFRSARNFEREKALRGLFQKYVPALVMSGVNALTHDGGEVAPRKSQVASLFVDMRGFTKRCEAREPEEIVKMLNLYAQYIVARVAESGGIIDKLIADGIYSFYPARHAGDSSHADAAIAAAVWMLAELDELERAFAERGYGPAEIGIGIHTGLATVGNMGCDLKLDYTAVGDSVNTAARLQDMSKEYRGRTQTAKRGIVVVSQSTLDQSSHVYPLQPIGEVSIRGRAQGEKIHFMDHAEAKQWVERTRMSLGDFVAILEELRNSSRAA